ncbi:hypothetical protein ARMSODRAFT_1089038 [Armillaria solidipes]|uniref:Uncharacterized protein n=1 Tax=Armillaria solidipes TaxID=1076256 RepID=A0A2H3B147_9AGAR|nr:hypothetical protein ARMSODRAFT_1089038 [Armillaria solidipes]
MIDVLWSKTGVWPVAYRRALFALKYLAKVLEREDGGEHMSVWCLEANLAMWLAGKPCWLGDLAFALGNIGVPDGKRTLEALTDAAKVRAVTKSLKELVKQRVLVAIVGCTKLPLLQGRIEVFLKGGKSDSPWLFRAYLLIAIPAHRIALTRLLTSCHDLAICCGRCLRGTHTTDVIPMQFRTCRLCIDDVEDKLHVLFVYAHPDLEDLRDSFLADVWRLYPALKNRARTPLELLNLMMAYYNLLPRLWKYLYDVLRRVGEDALYIDPSLTHRQLMYNYR